MHAMNQIPKYTKTHMTLGIIYSIIIGMINGLFNSSFGVDDNKTYYTKDGCPCGKKKTVMPSEAIRLQLRNLSKGK